MCSVAVGFYVVLCMQGEKGVQGDQGELGSKGIPGPQASTTNMFLDGNKYIIFWSHCWKR